MRSRARADRARRKPRTLAGLALLLVSAAPAMAQQVRLAEAPRTEAQRALETLLSRGEYELWVRDTVLARGDTVGGPLLVLEASARIAGHIAGDVFVVDGDLFMRARGSVAGDVVVLGGGFYDSDLASVGGTVTYRPNEPVRVRPSGGGFEIIHEVRPRPAFEADGTAGVHIPVYQRVDAVTIGVGGLARATGWPGRPELELVGRYRSGPSEFEASTRVSWYLSERLRIGVAAERATRTNEEWIRPTWYNSLAHVVAGDDARDYYRSDRAAAELEWISPEPPLWEDAPAWSFTVSGGWEEARSLAARDVWTLFGEDGPPCPACVPYPLPEPTAPNGIVPHPNPEVDEGDLIFGRAGFTWSMRTREGRLAWGVGLEAGFDDGLGTPEDDLDFLLAEGRISARRATSWGHAWDVFAIARFDLAGTLPGQRHSTMGGIGTIPTMPLRGIRGPRLLYGEASYAVPLLGLPTLGGLDVFVRASAGGAWTEGTALRIEEALAGGLAARLWDFQMEAGAAIGSAVPAGEIQVRPFFDVRVRRSARPDPMPRRGRGF